MTSRATERDSGYIRDEQGHGKTPSPPRSSLPGFFREFLHSQNLFLYLLILASRMCNDDTRHRATTKFQLARPSTACLSPRRSHKAVKFSLTPLFSMSDDANSVLQTDFFDFSGRAALFPPLRRSPSIKPSYLLRCLRAISCQSRLDFLDPICMGWTSIFFYLNVF